MYTVLWRENVKERSRLEYLGVDLFFPSSSSSSSSFSSSSSSTAGATTHCGFVFCSSLEGYSLLAYEVS